MMSLCFTHDELTDNGTKSSIYSFISIDSQSFNMAKNTLKFVCVRQSNEYTYNKLKERHAVSSFYLTIFSFFLKNESIKTINQAVYPINMATQ